MNQNEITDYKNYCILDCLNQNKELPDSLFINSEEFVNTILFFRKVDWISADNLITKKGDNARKRLSKKLKLKGLYLHLYPDFTRITSQDDSFCIYLP